MGVDAADVVKVNGIAKASIDNIDGYEFPGGTVLNKIDIETTSEVCDLGEMSEGTVYSSGTTLVNSYNVYDIYADSTGVTYANSYYYYADGTTTPYYYWSSSTGWGTTSTCGDLNGIRFDLTSSSCDGIASDGTTYTSGTSITDAYNNDYDIFTTSAGDTYMAAGYYHSGSTTNPYYQWNGTGSWTSSGSCSSLNQIAVGHGSASCVAIGEDHDVHTSGTSISDAYDNSYDIFSTSAGDTYATSYYYFDSTNEYVCYYWSGATGDWGVKNSCLTAYTGSSIESTSSSACEIPKLGTWYHSGTVSYPTDNDYIFSDQWGESAASAGFQKFVYLMDRFIEIDSNGQVDGIAGTCLK